MGNCWSVHQWLRKYGLITVCVCCPCCFLVYISCRHFLIFLRSTINGTLTSRSRIRISDDSDDADVDHVSSRQRSTALKRPNYAFFTNRRKSEPDGDYIDVIHREWNTDYDRLETHHGFIQWLFPTCQRGVNAYAYELQDDEIELIQQDDAAMERLLKSYEMMLGFYGIKLVDRETGQVQRAENWQERFHNLNRRTHNNLRISRILRCLGLFGLRHLQPPLVKFFLKEIVVEKTLYNCRHSCFKFWMSTLNVSAQGEVGDYAHQLELQESRHWTTEPTEDNAERADQWMNGKARGTPTTVFKQSTPKTQRCQIDNTGRAETDVSSHATEKDVGENHWDTSSTYRTATGDEQQELTTCSTSFQDDHRHHHQQQTESDDIQLETLGLLEGKDADDMIVSDQAATVECETGNQEQSEGTTIEHQDADYNPQAGIQGREKVEETKQKQASEQVGHCSPRTEIRDEIQQHEEQRVTLDVGEQDSEMDDHVQEETTQEQEQRASDSHQGKSESSEQQSSVEAADEQERDETIQQQQCGD